MGISLGEAHGRIVIDSSGALGSIGKVSKGLLGLGGGGGAFGVAAAGAVGLGAALTAGVVLPMGAAGLAVGSFIKSSVGIASGLEAQMDGVQAVMGATNEEIAQLKELTSELGLDPNLKISSLEAAQVIEMLGRNGLSAIEILDGAAHSTTLLANATGGDFPIAADIMTDAMAQFKIEAKDSMGVVDGITAVVNNSKFSIEDYGLALSQGGGLAGAFGVTLEDFNTVIAGNASLFQSGSDAGTSYKTFLQRLIPQSEKAISAQKALGLEFFDAEGKMKSQAQIAEELNRALYGTIEVTEEVNGRTGEQQDELDRLTNQYDKTVTSIKDYETGVKGANLTDEKREKKLAELRSQLGAMEAQMAPLEAIQGRMVTTTKQLTEEERNRYVNILFGTDASRTAIGLAQQGEVVYTDMAQAQRELGVEMDIINKYADGGITKFEALQIAMGQTDAAEAAATRMDNLAGSIEILEGIIETLKIRVGDEFIPIVKDSVDRLAGFLSDNQDDIVQFFAAIADWIGMMGERAGPVLDELIPALGELGRIFLGIGGDVYDTTEGIELFLLALGFSPEAVTSIVNVLYSIEDGLQTFTANLPGYIASVSEFVSGLLGVFQEGGFAGLAEYVWSWVGEAMGTGPDIMTGLINFISTFLTEQWPAISAALSQWKDKFFDWVVGEGGVISRVGEVLTGFAAAMLLWSQDPATQATMTQIGLGLADGLIGALQSLSEDQARIGLITAALFVMMGSVGLLALETFLNVGQSLAGGFVSGIVAWVTGGEPSSQLATVIGEMWRGVMQTIISTIMPAAALAFAVGQFNDIRTRIGEMDWLGIGTSLIDGMIEGVTGGAGRLADAVWDAAQEAWDAATSFWETNSPSKRMDELYQNVMAGGVQGIEAGSGSLVDASTAAAVAAGDAAALQAPTGGGTSPTQIAEALAGLAGGETNLTINFSGGNGGPTTPEESESAGFLIANALRRRGVTPG